MESKWIWWHISGSILASWNTSICVDATNSYIEVVFCIHFTVLTSKSSEITCFLLNFVVFSGKDIDFASVPSSYMVQVFANGSVFAESLEMTFSTWCLNSHKNWPHESVKCDIQIQLEPSANLTVMPLDNSFIIIPPVGFFENWFIWIIKLIEVRLFQHPKSYDYDEGEWHIKVVQSTIVNSPNAVVRDQFSKHASIKIETVLERNSIFYNQLISVPLIGSILRR